MPAESRKLKTDRKKRSITLNSIESASTRAEAGNQKQKKKAINTTFMKSSSSNMSPLPARNRKTKGGCGEGSEERIRSDKRRKGLDPFRVGIYKKKTPRSGVANGRRTGNEEVTATDRGQDLREARKKRGEPPIEGRKGLGQKKSEKPRAKWRRRSKW